jgi:hypothetical protein
MYSYNDNMIFFNGIHFTLLDHQDSVESLLTIDLIKNTTTFVSIINRDQNLNNTHSLTHLKTSLNIFIFECLYQFRKVSGHAYVC